MNIAPPARSRHVTKWRHRTGSAEEHIALPRFVIVRGIQLLPGWLTESAIWLGIGRSMPSLRGCQLQQQQQQWLSSSILSDGSHARMSERLTSTVDYEMS
jgi:hypothetical protein